MLGFLKVVRRPDGREEEVVVPEDVVEPGDPAPAPQPAPAPAPEPEPEPEPTL